MGVFPIAPTPFTESGDLDLAGQRRVLDCMIDQGVDGICILANYSEQFLLSDDERNALLDVCLTHVAGRVPVIVVDRASAQPIEVRVTSRDGRPIEWLDAKMIPGPGALAALKTRLARTRNRAAPSDRNETRRASAKAAQAGEEA